MNNRDRILFENRKYGERVLMLVPLDAGRYVLTGNDRQPLTEGLLIDLIPVILRHEPKPKPTRADALKLLEDL